jgi:hypothetical protein
MTDRANCEPYTTTTTEQARFHIPVHVLFFRVPADFRHPASLLSIWQLFRICAHSHERSQHRRNRVRHCTVIHLVLNWNALTRYILDKSSELFAFKREMIIALLVVLIVVGFFSSHPLHIP